MMVLVLVPLIAIIPLVGVRVVSEVGNLRAEGHIHGQTLVAQRISSLVSALSDERDLTEAALAGKGVGKDPQLAAAERTTTAEIQKFDDSLRQYQGSVNALPVAVQQFGARAEARLGDVGPLRAAIKRQGAGTPTFSAYSTAIDDLLDFSGQLAANSSDHQLGSLVATLAEIEQIELQTSNERGYPRRRAGPRRLHAGAEGGHRAGPGAVRGILQLPGEQRPDVAAEPVSVHRQRRQGRRGRRHGAGGLHRRAGGHPAQHPQAEQGHRVRADDGQAHGGQDRQGAGRQGVVRARRRTCCRAGRTQLYQNIAIILAVIVLSFLGALVLARSIVRPLRQLRGSALDIADNHLPEIVRRLRDAEPTDEAVRIQPIELKTQDEVGQVARAFDRVHFEAVRLATEQARMRSNVNAIFTNLSRRSESLVLRQLQLIDDLENSEQNPTQLASLFQLDHLATRMRRNNENLLVLAGEEQGRRWNQPVSLIDLVRAATAEVEQYERVVLYELPDVAVAGHAATDVVHLVAELIENATAYSAPETQVLIGARTLAAGDVVLDIADAGIGIRPEELDRINRRLAEPPVLDVAISRRMGLFVVGRLAGKYGIQVRLTSSGPTGLNALVRIPPSLLLPVSEVDSGGADVRPDGPAARSAGRLRPHRCAELRSPVEAGRRGALRQLLRPHGGCHRTRTAVRRHAGGPARGTAAGRLPVVQGRRRERRPLGRGLLLVRAGPRRTPRVGECGRRARGRPAADLRVDEVAVAGVRRPFGHRRTGGGSRRAGGERAASARAHRVPYRGLVRSAAAGQGHRRTTGRTTGRTRAPAAPAVEGRRSFVALVGPVRR